MLLMRYLFIVLFVFVYVAFLVGFPRRGATVVFSIDFAGAVRWQHIPTRHLSANLRRRFGAIPVFVDSRK